MGNSNLRKYNLFMGALHLVQAIAMYILSNDFSISVTTRYLTDRSGGGFPMPQTETLGDVRVGPWVALFLLLSAIAHFLISMPSIHEWYLKNLDKKINYVRWYEYAFSSSVMIVVIGLLCGITDFSLLIALFSLNAVMNLFGLMMELHNQTTKTINWSAYIFGVFAGIVPWIILALHFYNAIADVRDNIPSFVYWILLSLFLFFNSFAINMFLQYKKIGPWKDYLFGEKVYILLSLLAKTALAWQVWAGTLRPE